MEKISLVEFKNFNINNNHFKWINDPKITQHLITKKTTFRALKYFVINSLIAKECILFKILYNNFHVGNIKIDFNKKQNYAYIGYLIGESKYQNRGIATKAIKETAIYCNKNLGIKKIFAATKLNNRASGKALIKVGFRLYKKTFKHSELVNLYKLTIN